MQLTPQIALIGSGAIGLSNPYDCHVYLIESDGELALVDAGVGLDTARLLDNLRADGYDPRAVRYLLLTHSHADHGGGAAALREATGCRIVGSEPELALLARGTDEQLGLIAAKKNGTYPADYVYPHCEGDVIVTTGDEFALGHCRIRAIVVSGHSIAMTCYLAVWPDYRALFAGDAVFPGGFISLINVPGSDLAAYRAALPNLARLDVDGLFPGHHLFVVAGGQRHIDLALDRMERSVIPNNAIAWLPPTPSSLPKG